jgi:hypothetical protein
MCHRFWFTAVSGKQKQLNQINFTYLGLNPCLFEVMDIDLDLEKLHRAQIFMNILKILLYYSYLIKVLLFFVYMLETHSF